MGSGAETPRGFGYNGLQDLHETLLVFSTALPRELVKVNKVPGGEPASSY